MSANKPYGLSAVLAVLSIFILVAPAPPADAQQGPPFRSGEVVVAGSPGELTGQFTVVKYLPNADLTVLAVERGQEWGLVQRLRARGRKAGLNLIAQASGEVNDPLYPYQWHFAAVQADQAWSLTAGSGVLVAVLDTGLLPGGPDGIGCEGSGYNAVNPDLYPADGDGHGTHVSGTVAQATDNEAGVSGLAHAACVMPVKVLDDNGTGTFADIADGLYWAVNNGAHVVNMSLGTNARYRVRNDPFMDPALDYAYANDVTVVAAAGNDRYRRNVSYPAIYPTTIAVGATDLVNKLATYSNWGQGLDLVAPGGDITADLNGDGYADGVLQETFGTSGWGYYFYQGTSMASPHVAAAAAMLIAHATATTPDEVYTALTGTALDLGSSGYDKTFGHGLLQTYDALVWASPPPPPPPPGTCTDADGDGYYLEEGCGTEMDCDDTDSRVRPGHNDTKGRWGRNEVDNDCNGIIDG